MRIARILLTAGVILLGLAALAGRVLTPFITDHRDEIAAWLEHRIGVPVAIGSLRARWYGVSPLLELEGVILGDEADRPVIRKVSVELALSSLLRAAPLDALRITVDGLQLTVLREPSGQIRVEGIGRVGQDAGDSAAAPLPRHLRLVNTRVVWIDRRPGRPAVTIEDIDAVLVRYDEMLALGARLETASGQAILAARVKGFLTTTGWDGDTYLKVENLDVARLFAHYLPPRYGLRSLDLDLETWDHWENATPVRHQGRFALRDLELRPPDGQTGSLSIAHATADFSLHRPAPGELRLGLAGLSLTMGGRRWPSGDVALSLSGTTEGFRRVAAAADYLQLDDLARILLVRPPLAALEQPLRGLGPRGEIHDLRLQLEMTPDGLEWRGQARLVGIGTEPWEGIPGIEGLDARLHSQADHLVLQLDSHDSLLRFDGLFRDSLPIERLQGRVDLLRHPDGWQVRGERLLADTPHIRTLTRLDLRQRGSSPMFLDLQTDFRDGDAAAAGRYYPVGIMQPSLVSWLDRSIVSGRIVSGTALVYGPLDEFAFSNSRNGSFQAVFDTEDLLLDYRQGWPRLERLDARVKFHGNQLDILTRGGTIYDSRVVDTRAHIGSLDPAGPLQVSGRLDGPLADKLRVLGEDALKDRFGEIAAALRGEGESRLLLDFTVPLAELGDYALDGQLHFDDARLSLPDWDFAMSSIHGRLDFDLDGLSARSVRARTLGAPVIVDVARLANGTTRVRTRGNFGVSALRHRLPALPTGLAEGRTDVVVDVEIPSRRAPADTPTVLAVDSDLEGIAVSLPSPFGKTAGARRALSLRLPLTGRPTPARLNYGDRVAAAFSRDGQRVDIRLGGGAAKLRSDTGIRVEGRLAAVDVTAWREALARLAPAGGGTALPLTLDLQIDRLDAAAFAIDDLEVHARHVDGGWRGEVEASILAGRFEFPDALDTTPVRVQLDRLSLSLPVGQRDTAPTPPPDPSSGPDPTGLPGLTLDITELQVNQARLGRLHFEARPAPQGLKFTGLRLEGGELALDSAGHWLRTDNRFETHLGGRISTGDLGDLLVKLGYSRQVEGAAGDIGFLLRWPGNPAQIHRATLSGRVSPDIANGRLIELDPGATRIVGLLNLNALTRRLRLDFSDFYKKGYSFDSIKGDFAIGAGKASTNNFTVLGPSGRITLDGSANLTGRTLDQHVTVVPKLDATLPIAGTLAGGPIAGIAVLVAQQVMTKDIDKLNRFEYRLEGPWANPRITQLDSGGALSKLFKPLSGGSGKADDTTSTASDATPDPVQPAGALTRQPPDVSTEAASTQAPSATSQNPLRGLLDMLETGDPHGGDLPGVQ